ncbi:MAG: glycoside hydrolase family 3 C-terminal domain-containing protein, partial [Clostridia bacterium]|nr:glycoside hydrolase family 3 C-terminal domain-containing protein [Clostridia bacterium]
RLDEKYVDLCVEHILTVHERYLRKRRPDTPWDKEKDHELAGRLAAECLVLLKNEDGILPLSDEDSVAVIGEFAVKPRFQGGGSSHINCFRVTSLMDALADKATVCYAQGYHIDSEDEDAALVDEAVKAAAAAKKVVVVAGLPDSFESEGYDRSHMRMPANQNALIEKLAEVNPNIVVLLYNGSPVEMPWNGKVKGIIEGYLAGQNVGTANRAVLYGEVNPCGRLPETLPIRLEDTPCYLSYGGEGNTAVYNEGVFVGYRYYDKKKMDVLYPFGHGLSYTTFAYSNLKLSADSIKDTETLTVTVDVTNTGKIAGKEVVQLYISDPESSVFRPIRELKGFEKVELAPGETKTVSFELDKRAFAYWSIEIHDWYVESGAFEVQIGRSSRDIELTAKVNVTGTREIPTTFTEDSIVMDIMQRTHNPEALKKAMKQGFAVFDSDDDSAASEAVTDDMTMAMMSYMPLRGMTSFGGFTHEQLDELLKTLNA